MAPSTTQLTNLLNYFCSLTALNPSFLKCTSLRSAQAHRNRQARDASHVTTEMKSELIAMLGLFGLPYVLSPGEAEAQCAELEVSERASDEFREMATDIMATSTTKLTHSYRLAPSSLGAAPKSRRWDSYGGLGRFCFRWPKRLQEHLRRLEER
mgnify:CR=1 FL=1